MDNLARVNLMAVSRSGIWNADPKPPQCGGGIRPKFRTHLKNERERGIWGASRLIAERCEQAVLLIRKPTVKPELNGLGPLRNHLSLCRHSQELVNSVHESSGFRARDRTLHPKPSRTHTLFDWRKPES